MALRTLLAVCLFAFAAASGCVGVSGQRFYEGPSGAGDRLNDVVDCPTCPSSSRGHVATTPAVAHDDGVIPPHAKFHPVPTRPVFAPKVVPAVAIAESTPAKLPTPAAAVAVDDSDDAPAPPPATIVSKPSSRSVLKRSEPQLLAEETMKSVLVERKIALTAAIEQTSTTPTPIPETAPATTASPRPTSDGWRPRVAN